MFECIVLGVLMYLGMYISHPLGQLIDFLISWTLVLPRVGGLCRFVLAGPVKFVFLQKLVVWSICASGPLLGIWIYAAIYDWPSQPAEFWIVLAFSAITTLNMIDKVIMFRVVNYPELQELAKKSKWVNRSDKIKKIVSQPGVTARLSRTQFIDTYIPYLFMLLICFGLLVYSMTNLQIIEINRSTPLTITESLLYSLTFIGFSGDAPIVLSGTIFTVLKLIWTFIVFIYLVLFISLASSLVDEDSQSLAGADDEKDEGMGNVNTDSFQGTHDGAAKETGEGA